MALTIISQPQLLTPAYNPVIIEVTSTNQNLPGHQFICDIYESNTSNRIARVKLPAFPDGIGKFDVHRILENYVSFDLVPTSTGFTHSPDSSYEYDLQLGEEYQFFWPFDDNFDSGLALVGFTSNTVEHLFIVGDRVNIVQDPGYTFEQYNGVHSVVSIITPFSFAVNQALLGPTAANPGTAIYSNSRKTIFAGLTAISGLTINNSAFSHLDWLDFSTDDFNMTGGTAGKFFTDMPTDYPMRLDNKAWINYYASSGNTVQTAIINSYNSAGDVEGVYFHNTSTPINYRNFAIGPKNIIEASISPSGGTGSVLPILKSSTTRYEIYFIDDAEIPISETRSITLDRTCTKYNNVQLIFLDRKGSLIPANFQLSSRESVDIKREEYTKPVPFGYDAQDRGRSNFNTDIQRKYTATSNWMNETEGAFMEQLFSSPEVYWNDNGVIKPVIITSNKYLKKDRQHEQLINYTINFELAYSDNIQRD